MHPIETLLTPLGRAFRDRRAGAASSVFTSAAPTGGQPIALTSPAFADGAEIPAKHCGWLIGENVSPALGWGALPDGTVDLVLVIEDVDGPGSRPRIHTVAAFAPTGDGLPEGALAAGSPGVRFLPRGRRPGGYAGPRPLPGHGPHHYRFHLFAVDREFDLAGAATPEQVAAALAGHVLGAGMLTGTREA